MQTEADYQRATTVAGYITQHWPVDCRVAAAAEVAQDSLIPLSNPRGTPTATASHSGLSSTLYAAGYVSGVPHRNPHHSRSPPREQCKQWQQLQDEEE